MKNIGYITLWGAECVFVEGNDGIFVIPKEKD